MHCEIIVFIFNILLLGSHYFYWCIHYHKHLFVLNRIVKTLCFHVIYLKCTVSLLVLISLVTGFDPGQRNTFETVLMYQGICSLPKPYVVLSSRRQGNYIPAKGTCKTKQMVFNIVQRYLKHYFLVILLQFCE